MSKKRDSMVGVEFTGNPDEWKLISVIVDGNTKGGFFMPTTDDALDLLKQNYTKAKDMFDDMAEGDAKPIDDLNFSLGWISMYWRQKPMTNKKAAGMFINTVMAALVHRYPDDIKKVDCWFIEFISPLITAGDHWQFAAWNIKGPLNTGFKLSGFIVPRNPLLDASITRGHGWFA